MRALLCERPCDWDELSVQDIAEPAMITGGVRIAVQAASVSFAMSLQVAGEYQRTYPKPFVPGTEVGGVVLEVDTGVSEVQVGDNQRLRHRLRSLALARRCASGRNRDGVGCVGRCR